MAPPVALLVYNADDPTCAAFYPYAAFSPEWIAMLHAAAAGSAGRFIDLPQSLALAQGPEAEPPPEHSDPLSELAKAAGYGDGERWWDEAVESHSGDATGVFDAVAEAMSALREGEGPVPLREEAREAHMRSEMRRATAEGFMRIAVVCGAWHVPALRRFSARGQASQDAAALRGLPKVKTAAAWVPWSYERLASASGYGAGVVSPEWYHAIWQHGQHLAARWLATAAYLIRGEGLDASPASVIQTVRLAQALAAMRGRARPTLGDLDEAALSALCHADEAPMALVWRRLAIGERLGEVPEGAPATPVQTDFVMQTKRLRLKPESGSRALDLDLRNATDLDRSRLLHRLALLGIAWGAKLDGGRGTGTFREPWTLAWQPEFAILLVSASRRGATIAEAATAAVIEQAAEHTTIADLARTIAIVLDADLAEAACAVTKTLSDRSALSTDVFDLMDALPPLANLARYGSVRGPDVSMVNQLVGGIVPRVAAGLVSACHALDAETAAAAARRLLSSHQAIVLLEDNGLAALWLRAVHALSADGRVPGRVAGKATRILFDAFAVDAAEAGVRLRFALSRGADTLAAAAWVEGFLESSGAVLVHGSTLLPVIDGWLTSLPAERFMEILPVLRRTFSGFTKPERHDIGDRIRTGAGAPVGTVSASGGIPSDRGERTVPILRLLLGEAA